MPAHTNLFYFLTLIAHKLELKMDKPQTGTTEPLVFTLEELWETVKRWAEGKKDVNAKEVYDRIVAAATDL